MFRQTRTFSHLKFNDLKTKSLQGDVSATIELHNLCMKQNAGISLSDVMPVLYLHLSNQSLASARTFTDSPMDSLPVLNAIPSLKLLQYFLDEDRNPGRDNLPFLSSIFPSLIDWLYLLLEGMGILSADFRSLSFYYEDLIEYMSLLIHSLAQYPSLYHRLRAAPGFVPFFLNCWIRVSAAGCYISQVACATVLLSIFGKEVDQPSFKESGDSVVLHAIRERPVEVSKAAVQGVVSLVNKPMPPDFEGVITMVLEAMNMPRSCSPICVRALLSNNALTWLCRLAIRVMNPVSKRDARILSRIMRDIDALLLRAHANNVALVLEAAILEIVLCVEPMSCHPHVFPPSDLNGSDELQKTLLSIIATLTGFVMYRSLLSHFRKSVRRIERESLADGSSPVLEAYGELAKLVRTRSEWMKAHDASSTRCPCVNPNCLCKSGPRRCTKADLQQCLGCSFAIYCSRACQKEHWSRGSHKVHCSRLDDARLKGSQLLPISPRDAAALYGTVEEDLTRPPREIFGTDKGRNLARVFRDAGFDEEIPPTTVLNVEVARPRPIHRIPMSVPILTCTTLDEVVERMVERNRAVSDKDHFEGCIERAKGGGPFVAITLANGILVDLTSVSRIRKGIYPVEVYGDVKAS